MKFVLLGFLMLSCVQNLNAQLLKDDPADLGTLVAEVRALQTEVKFMHNKLAIEERLRSELEEHMQIERRIRDKEISALTEADAANKDMILSLNEHIAQKVTEQIAFSVHTQSNFGPVTVLTKMPFPYENVNIGGGWQSHIDAFQAPIAGHYFFFASIRSVDDSFPHVRIIHTDQSGDHVVAGMVSSGSSGNGDANSAIVYLEEGDYASVQLDRFWSGNGMVYSSSAKYTTFSGFRLT